MLQDTFLLAFEFSIQEVTVEKQMTIEKTNGAIGASPFKNTIGHPSKFLPTGTGRKGIRMNTDSQA